MTGRLLLLLEALCYDLVIESILYDYFSFWEKHCATSQLNRGMKKTTYRG